MRCRRAVNITNLRGFRRNVRSALLFAGFRVSSRPLPSRVSRVNARAHLARKQYTTNTLRSCNCDAKYSPYNQSVHNIIYVIICTYAAACFIGGVFYSLSSGDPCVYTFPANTVRIINLAVPLFWP